MAATNRDDMLVELNTALKESGIELCFAEMKDPVKDKLKRFGIFAQFGETRFYPTIDEAVSGLTAVRDWR